MPETEEKRSRFSDITPSYDETQNSTYNRYNKKRTHLSRIINRRVTCGFAEVIGVKPELSSRSPNPRKPIKSCFNTYQLEPKKRFDFDRVKAVVDDILMEFFDDHFYNAETSPGLAIRIASETRRRVKQENYDRYRLICVVTIGQNLAQSYNNAVTFLWDHERDNYVNVNKKIMTGFIQVSIFAVYLD